MSLTEQRAPFRQTHPFWKQRPETGGKVGINIDVIDRACKIRHALERKPAQIDGTSSAVFVDGRFFLLRGGDS